jgi:hypothetical protein
MEIEVGDDDIYTHEKHIQFSRNEWFRVSSNANVFALSPAQRKLFDRVTEAIQDYEQEIASLAAETE